MNNRKFKVGDCVRCKSPSNWWKRVCEGDGYDVYGVYQVKKLTTFGTIIKLNSIEEYCITENRWELAQPKIELKKEDCM